MKVALELQPCCKEPSGVGMYTYELAKRLKSDDEVSFCGNLFNFLNRNDHSELLRELSFPINKSRLFPYGVYRRTWNYLPFGYNKIFPKTDVTHFFNYIVPPKISGKVVTTIHDMAYIRFPETLNSANLRRIKQGIEYSVRRSDVLITVSEFSKREIVDLLHVPEEKIVVIPNASSLTDEQAPFEVLRAKYHLEDKPYLLYMGTIEPRKNLVRLIQAFDKVKKTSGLPHKLILAGGKGWKSGEIYCEAEQATSSSDIIFTGYISPAEKNTLYKNAELFVFPSLYEGFGIPVLEAMSFGVPVICSNAASLPEVVGDCAELVDPLSVEDIASTIERLLGNSTRRDELISKGIGRAKGFSWDTSASQLMTIYKSVGEGNKT